ncbi:hypothetical protein EVAR_17928_1 [Eumeta japonica]|uniref:Uncharacterized protein n=1 Tax=Eumeta variegata TaxID=151549 RepID=A0A4C1UYY1_EUMVA|nr:hypothetical protein EVAR_17928_1 [Eumeta japonica]
MSQIVWIEKKELKRELSIKRSATDTYVSKGGSRERDDPTTATGRHPYADPSGLWTFPVPRLVISVLSDDDHGPAVTRSRVLGVAGVCFCVRIATI